MKLNEWDRKLVYKFVNRLKEGIKSGEYDQVSTMFVEKKTFGFTPAELDRLEELGLIQQFNDTYTLSNKIGIKVKILNMGVEPVFIEDLPEPPRGVSIDDRKPVALQVIRVYIKEPSRKVEEYIEKLLDIAGKNKLLGVQICNGYRPVGGCDVLYTHEDEITRRSKMNKILGEVKKELERRREKRKVKA